MTMAIAGKMLFSRAKETLEIKNIHEEEFAERLRLHIGGERIGRPFNENKEFSGVVTRNSFEIRRNSVAKIADHEVYGKFRTMGDHLTLTLTITHRPLEWILGVVSLVSVLFYVSEDIYEGKYDLLVFAAGALILFGIISHVSKVREIEKVCGHIRDVFSDKEIV